MKAEMPDIEPEINNNNAVSIYDQGDAMEDFPVLRAFQQYVDAEQAKSRKRLLTMGIFFGILIIVIIGVFMTLLVTVSERNQALNDKMLEFVMKEHDRDREKFQQQQPAAPVVVQPPQDNSAILALTSKLDEMQKKLTDSQAATEKALREKSAAEAAAIEAAKPKAPTPQELEIERLTKLLSDQKAQAEAEKKRRKEEELEAYRRKHYPELYATQMSARKSRKRVIEIDDYDEDLDDEIEDAPPSPRAVKKSSSKDKFSYEEMLKALDDGGAINYFDDEEEEITKPAEKEPVATKSLKPLKKSVATDDWQIPEE